MDTDTITALMMITVVILRIIVTQNMMPIISVIMQMREQIKKTKNHDKI